MLRPTPPNYEAQLTALERYEAQLTELECLDDPTDQDDQDYDHVINLSLLLAEQICETLNPSLKTIQNSNTKELNTWFVDKVPLTDLYTIRFNGIFSSPAKLAELKQKHGSNLIEDPNGFHELKIDGLEFKP